MFVVNVGKYNTIHQLYMFFSGYQCYTQIVDVWVSSVVSYSVIHGSSTCFTTSPNRSPVASSPIVLSCRAEASSDASADFERFSWRSLTTNEGEVGWPKFCITFG